MTTICFFITHIKLTYRLPHISNFMQVSFRAQWLDRFVPWLRRNVLFTRCIFIWHATRPTISCMYIYCVLGRSRSTDCLWFVICQGALLVSQPIPSVTIQPSSPNNPPTPSGNSSGICHSLSSDNCANTPLMRWDGKCIQNPTEWPIKTYKKLFHTWRD